MTDTRYDRAPGDRPTLIDMEAGAPSGMLVYTIGLVLAVILTAISFWSPTRRCCGPPASRSALRS